MRGFPDKAYYQLRFQILLRDSFTCQYCGQRAPDVVLHVDHKIPVCDGGTDNEDNLITACSACNIGKEGLRARSDGRRGKVARERLYVARVELSPITMAMEPKTKTPTWAELAALEPRLTTLMREAKAIKDTGGPSFCANDAFYGRHGGKESLKNRIADLVGWDAGYGYHEYCAFSDDDEAVELEFVTVGNLPDREREYEPHPLLKTSKAYDVAYDTIYNVLPPCRNCWCG